MNHSRSLFRRIVGILLVAVTIVSISACSKKTETSGTTEKTATETPADLKARMKKEIDAKNAEKVAQDLSKEIDADH